MEAHSDDVGMSGTLDWVLKEPKHKDSALRGEIPGMSVDWDWVLKETSRAASVARRKTWESACGFGSRPPRV